MDIEIIRRICLARHLYEIGNSYLKSDNSLYWFSAVNLIQDSVEAFLLAVSDYVKANVDSNTKFDKYFICINEKISPKELPFKDRLIRLNRIRIDSKHFGIQPAKDECCRLAIAVREFFEEVSKSILNENYSTVSTIDLIKEGEVKETLCAAKIALESGDIVDCSIYCRKAIYLELEKEYDVSEFKDKTAPTGLLGAFSKAPYYAKNSKYIDENIKDPTDYIVYDHNTIDQELLKYGVDNTSFWNLWRLTPKIFKTKAGEWVVKREFAVVDLEALKDKIEYIFSTTVDIILAIHAKKSAVRSPGRQRFYLELKQEAVPIYEKADCESKVSAVTPPNLLKLDCNFSVLGLKGDEIYWHVTHLEGDNFYYGYIKNEFIK